MNNYVFAITAVILMMFVWAMVQDGWKKVFSDQTKHDDALDARGKCGNCNCPSSVCKKDIIKIFKPKKKQS